MIKEEVSIQNLKVNRINLFLFIFIKRKIFYLDERRRRIILQLKSLTPDMEKIHTSTIYHFLKTKSPKMVQVYMKNMNSILSFYIQDICCIDGKRAEELYNLARYAKVLLPGSKQTPFFLTTNDLYVII